MTLSAGRAIDGAARYAATRENRLRVSGLAALALVLVAVAAYGSGVLLARVTGADTPRTVAAGAAEGAQKQPATPEPVASPPQPVAAATAVSNEPPADPAARAAFYMARAKSGDAAAQYDLGVLYARGDGLVQDYASAISWFQAAAAQGNVAAEYNLGVLYAGGLGVAANQTEALNWYRSAADQNHPGAQFNLALAYAQGTGTQQDLAAAARWYQRAAQQGLGPAMINLAILYERGGGVAASPVDAYAWYSAAGEHGEPQGKRRADALFAQFSDRDKARAQGLAATIGAALDASAAPPTVMRPPA
jgi:TPR repeat protein